MAGPPPHIFAPTIAIAALARQAVEVDPPRGPVPPPRPKPPKRPRRRVVAQVLTWMLGAGGYLGLLLAAHASSHADLLRGLAVAWLIIFGALNAHHIMQRR